MDPRTLRRNFVGGLFLGLRVVWPILSVLLLLVVALGCGIGWIEGWRVSDSLYFSFVTALTIGYGDLAPKTLNTRSFAVLIGLCGVLSTAHIAGGRRQGLFGKGAGRETRMTANPLLS